MVFRTNSIILLITMLVFSCSNKSGSSDFYSVEHNVPIVYLAAFENIFIKDPVLTMGDNVSELSDELIIPKGRYFFQEQEYDLDREGVVRFMAPGKGNLQRIVFDGSLDTLMSSFAWLTTHGILDDNLSFESKSEVALTSKLSTSCGPTSHWIKYLLSQFEFKSRVVYTKTLSKSTGGSWGMGHVMLEVFHSNLSKWVLYDIDNNYTFSKNGIGLSFLELFRLIESNQDFDLISLSDDIESDLRFGTENDDYDYAFITEMQLNDIEGWYRRRLQIVLINNEYYDSTKTDDLNKFPGEFRNLPYKTFVEKYYPE